MNCSAKYPCKRNSFYFIFRANEMVIGNIIWECKSFKILMVMKNALCKGKNRHYY